MFNDDELNEFFQLIDGAGVAATYDGGQISISFRNTYIDAEGIESSQPNLTGKVSDFPAASQTVKNTIIINGTTYKFMELQPDGNGFIRILLHEQ